MSPLIRTQDEFLKAQGKAGPSKLVILMYYVDWSGVCAQLYSAYQGMAKMYGWSEDEDHEDSMRCIFLRADMDDAEPELIRGIYALPTFRFYRGGLAIDTLYTPDHAQLERRIRKYTNEMAIATSTKGKPTSKNQAKVARDAFPSTPEDRRDANPSYTEDRVVLA